jgi:hypothetical protein
MLLAGLGVLAASCGTKVALAGNLASAAAHTASQTARVSMTATMATQGMSVSFTQTGAFDFAHSRGVLRMHGPGGMASEELFLSPRMYVRLPGGALGPLLRGKSWIAINDAASGALGASLLGPFGSTDPRDLLSSLTVISRSVTKLGTATIRGVQVIHFRVSIDPAKAASRLPRWQRAGFEAFARSLGPGTIPADVWVDQQNLVRRVKLSLHPPAGPGAPAGTRLTQTADFYDFGVPVRVSAPPAAEVASLSQLAKGSATKATGFGSFGSAQPPRVSGALSPAQAAAAEQAVRAFWSALGSNDAKATAQTVLPAQRSCVRLVMGGLRFTVTSLRIVSAQPAGNARAAVRFTVKADASIGGQRVPVFPQGRGRVQWLVATEAGGHWYVDLGRSTSLVVSPACQ